MKIIIPRPSCIALYDPCRSTSDGELGIGNKDITLDRLCVGMRSYGFRFYIPL